MSVLRTLKLWRIPPIEWPRKKASASEPAAAGLKRPRKRYSITSEFIVWFRGTVTLKRNGAAMLKVTPLDFTGYPKSAVESAAQVKLQSDTIYYLIGK